MPELLKELLAVTLIALQVCIIVLLLNRALPKLQHHKSRRDTVVIPPDEACDTSVTSSLYYGRNKKATHITHKERHGRASKKAHPIRRKEEYI